jgi:predicted phosphodiesterase
VECCGSFIYLLHDLKTLDLDPSAAGMQMVISGHSHRPNESRKNGVLYLNPGSAGPRRFKLPVTAALLQIDESGEITWKVDGLLEN